jgi:hypothetical protein
MKRTVDVHRTQQTAQHALALKTLPLKHVTAMGEICTASKVRNDISARWKRWSYRVDIYNSTPCFNHGPICTHSRGFVALSGSSSQDGLANVIAASIFVDFHDLSRNLSD